MWRCEDQPQNEQRDDEPFVVGGDRDRQLEARPKNWASFLIEQPCLFWLSFFDSVGNASSLQSSIDPLASLPLRIFRLIDTLASLPSRIITCIFHTTSHLLARLNAPEMKFVRLTPFLLLLPNASKQSPTVPTLLSVVHLSTLTYCARQPKVETVLSKRQLVFTRS
jgi:hypothetical protein